MSKRRSKLPENLVPHPRYGVKITPSGFKLPRAGHRPVVLGLQGRNDLSRRTAIPADLARQRYTVPRTYYVDILRQCRGCKRPFVFYAREQKYWYETLGFDISADCLHCPECRRTHHRFRRRFRRYSESIVSDDLSDAELAVLVEDAVFLYEAGVLGEQRLRRLKNLAVRRIPDEPATGEVLDVLSKKE